MSDLVRDPLFVPETMKVDDLFRDMQRTKIHMAIVLDEYGGTAGIVTIEDLLEEIVGDIQDEYDVEEPDVEEIDEHEFIVHARLSIDELNSLLDTEIEAEDVDSVGGLIISRLGRIPVEHDKVVLDEGVELEVLRVEQHALGRVRAIRRSTDGRDVTAFESAT